jgi:hypothetical protein
MEIRDNQIIDGYEFVADDTDEQMMYFARDWYPESCYVCIQDNGLFQAVHYGECLSADIEDLEDAITELELQILM